MPNWFNGIIIPIVLVVGPVIGYIPQYREIQATRNFRAFSPLVSLILLVSNILRIFFWVEKRFEIALLLQSVVMIAAQLLLLELIVRLRRHSNRVAYIPTRESYSFFGIKFGQFWQWDDYRKYVLALGVFSAVFAGLTVLNMLVIRTAIYTEITGTLALLIESTLAMPQFYQNYRLKSTRGLRAELVAAWAIGDSLKVILFIARRSPIQFLACGIVQLIVDFGIFYQMRQYRHTTAARAIIEEAYEAEERILASKEFSGDEEVDVLVVKPQSSQAKSLDNFDMYGDEEDPPKILERSRSTRSSLGYYRTL